ncbi:hypothetical protein CRYUN_Cryun04dG0013000 [Craigia yunnanensis]
MKKLDGSIEIVRMLMSRGISLQVSTCNALVWEVSKCRGANKGCEVYKEVFGVRNAFCEEGKVREAEKLWEETRVKRLEPDIVAYNTMIDGLCVSGEINRADELFREMGLNGIEATCVTYENLINGYCNVVIYGYV